MVKRYWRALFISSFLALLVVKGVRDSLNQARSAQILSLQEDSAGEGDPGTEGSVHHAAGRRRLLGTSRNVVEEVKKWKEAQGKREKEDSDSIPKPERAPGEPYTLGPKISDWDEQRAAYIKKHPGCNMKKGKERILLVTGSQPKICDNNIGDHLLLKSIKNKLDYCNLMGIDVFYNFALFDKEMSGFWSKLPLFRRLMLSHPEVEWFWWMDSDAMFTDMSFQLPMERYKDYNMVLHGWDELVYHQKNWIGLNTGSFLMRNNQWMLDLLDEWAPMGPKGKPRDDAGKLLTATLKGRPAFEADDQSALVWLLAQQRDRWGALTYLESAFYLHGYWAILVHKYEEMIEKHHPGLGDDRWPFVTHFVGCKPCGKLEELDLNEFSTCIHNMERAYNFADNQLLRQFGYEHVDLSSTSVRSVNGSTKMTEASQKSAARALSEAKTETTETT